MSSRPNSDGRAMSCRTSSRAGDEAGGRGGGPPADGERLAVLGERVRRDVGEELVPGGLVELAFQVLGVDARIPVEALDDALRLHLRTGGERDELGRELLLR